MDSKSESKRQETRLELLSLEHSYGENYIMVMSFHFSDKKFKKEDFPYRRTGDC